jgi:chromosome segregation ATPase
VEQVRNFLALLARVGKVYVVGQLRHDLEGTKRECVAATSQRDELVSTVNRLTRERENDEAAQVQMVSQLSAARRTVESAEKMNVQLVDRHQKELAAVNEKLERARATVEDMKVRLQQAEASKDSLQATVVELRRMLEQNSDQVIRNKAELDAAREQSRHLEARNIDLSSQLQHLSATLEVMRNEYGHAKEGKQHLEAKLEVVLAERDGLLRDLGKSRELQKGYDHVLAEHVKEIEAVSSKLATLQADTAKKDTVLKSLEESLMHASETLDQHKVRFEAQHGQLRCAVGFFCRCVLDS